MSGRSIVVGGGLSGLAAAHTLAKAGHEVLVLEASDRPGGVVRTERRDGFLLEAGPNTVRPTAELWRLIEELGLAGEVLLADARSPRYVDFGGELHAVPMSPAGLLTTGLLSTAGKLRLLAEPFRRRRGTPEESVRDFFSRRLGPEVADRLVEPFVAGIFAGSAARLSMTAAFPRLALWEREHGSLLRGGLASRRKARTATSVPKGLLTFRGGFQTLPEALAGSLGSAFRARVAVEALTLSGGRWIVHTSGKSYPAKTVVVAAPAYRASMLLSSFAPEAARALSQIPHPPLAVLHLAWPESALRRPLRGFGHLVVPDPRRRILGAVWTSALFPDRAPSGMVLLTVFLGGARDPGALDLSDEELSALAARDLAAERLAPGDPRLLMLTRWERAIPQYERGHEDRIRALARAEAQWPGLRLLGNYRGGVSVADVIASATAVMT
ncbi:MAG TPA: protoporphyrinogen oxidase [Thermoanaerobaculia bacterium]|jgi:oxygen-dependent protoporphyrinogen oxidase